VEQEGVRLSLTGTGRISHSQTWFRRDRRCWSSRWVPPTTEWGKRLYITIGNRSGFDRGPAKADDLSFLVTNNSALACLTFRLLRLRRPGHVGCNGTRDLNGSRKPRTTVLREHTPCRPTKISFNSNRIFAVSRMKAPGPRLNNSWIPFPFPDHCRGVYRWIIATSLIPTRIGPIK
jgi:hypothetical protein